MPRTLLLVGTRKGTFLLESDADRRDWATRGPYCEGWPVYHAVHDAGTDTIYAAAASEWHGSAVWRSADRGETWEHSSEGIAYDADAGRKISKVSNLAVKNGRVLVGVEAPGIFESRDGGSTFSLLSTLEGQPGSEVWDDPANQPPGHLGISALMFDPDEDARFWAIVQGIGLFETADDAESWTPRNRGLRADWPREHEEVGFCVHKRRALARRRRPHVPAEPRRHAPQRRRAATRGRRSPRACRPSSASPPPRTRTTARRSTSIPLDPGHGADDARRPRRRLAHARRRLELAAARPTACRRRTRIVGVLREGMAIDTLRRSRASTSARAPARSSRAPTRARAGARSPSYLPAISSVEVAIVD